MLKRLFTHWFLMCILTLFGGMAGIILSLLVPQEYRSSVQLLVTQKQMSLDGTNLIDGASATAGAGRIGTILASAVYSDAFFDAAVGTRLGLEQLAPQKRRDQRIFWKQHLNATMNRDTNVLTLTGRADRAAEAHMIVRSAAFVFLTTAANDFHGAGSLLKVSQLNEALEPDRPSLVPLMRRAGVGFGFGLLVALGISWILAFRSAPEQEGVAIPVKIVSARQMRERMRHEAPDELASVVESAVQEYEPQHGAGGGGEQEEDLRRLAGSERELHGPFTHRTMFDDLARLGLEYGRVFPETETASAI